MSQDIRTEIVPIGIELAMPGWSCEQWCHPECHTRWAVLDDEMKQILGGHVHYDKELSSWKVPSPAPVIVKTGYMKLQP